MTQIFGDGGKPTSDAASNDGLSDGLSNNDLSDKAAQQQLAGLAVDSPPVMPDYLPDSAELPDGGDSESYEETAPAKKPYSKLLFVFSAVGLVIGFVLFIVFGLNRPAQKVSKPDPNPSESVPTTVPDQSAPLRSQLAFQDQKRTVGQSAPVPSSTPSPTSTSQGKSAKADQKAPRRASRAQQQLERRSESSPAPERPVRTVYRSVPAPAPEPAPRRASASSGVAKPEVIDPYERWATLASSTGESSVAESGRASQPVDPGFATAPVSAGQAQVASTPAPGAFQTVVVGGSGRTGLSSSEPIAVPPSQPTPVPDPVSNSAGSLVSLTQSITAPQFSEPGTQVALSPGGRGILQRRSPSEADDEIVPVESIPSDEAEDFEVTADRAPVTVQLGTMVTGEVVVPMVWDLNRKKSGQTNAGRFSIQLSQDLKSGDGQVALPVGTTLIVQATDVSEANQLVQASAIAVVYRDGEGAIMQQPLPLGALLVQGQGGSALMAKKLNDVGPALFREDLLVGGLRALGRAGEVLNQPSQESITTTNSSTGEIVTGGTSIIRSRNPELVYGLLDGFGNAISQRIEQRSQQSTQALIQSNTIAVLPQGTQVTVLVNSFFQVNW